MGTSDRLSASARAAGIDQDDWIVVFKDGTQDPPGLARKLTAEHGGSIRHTYTHAIQGFAGQIPPQAIEGIQKNPNVAFVERDGVMRKTAVGSWGLDRIDQRTSNLDNTYSTARDGSGVDVYIIDTGIDYLTYDGGIQFGSRLDQAHDVDYVDDDDDASDCDGHGTHVAGTVGSTGYGVAPGVTLIGVRVLNCQGSGSYSDVIAGIEYAASSAAISGNPSVANMSLSGGYSSAVNSAVNSAAGVVFAVSSGNSNTDACNQSPASAASAITVNASTISDARSSFSNYGTCTDIFAPGSSITSTIMGGDTQAWNGTSMAAPHVAGVAALILDEGVAAAVVWPTMQDRATRDAISGVNGSPNLLLYSGTESGDPCVSAGCPPAEVQWVSQVTVKTNRGKNGSGTVTVQVVEAGGSPLGGVTVNGSWTVNGDENYRTSTGVTDGDGMVDLSTGGIRFATTFDFCVTELGGAIVDVTDYGASPPRCNVFGEPYGDGGTVDPPPTTGAPANFSATPVQKGRNYRARLEWTGGAPAVDIVRDGAVIAAGVSNSGSYNDNLGKSDPATTFTYEVCNAATSVCSEPDDAAF